MGTLRLVACQYRDLCASVEMTSGSAGGAAKRRPFASPRMTTLKRALGDFDFAQTGFDVHVAGGVDQAQSAGA